MLLNTIKNYIDNLKIDTGPFQRIQAQSLAPEGIKQSIVSALEEGKLIPKDRVIIIEGAEFKDGGTFTDYLFSNIIEKAFGINVG